MKQQRENKCIVTIANSDIVQIIQLLQREPDKHVYALRFAVLCQYSDATIDSGALPVVNVLQEPKPPEVLCF